MRKITFHINDLEWMKRYYKMKEKDFKNIFGNKIPFQVIYVLIGNKNPDRYELSDLDGNRLNINDMNGYEKSVVLNDCYNYFIGKTSDPHGAISITEEII